VDERFYNPNSYSVTPEGKKYFSAIFEEIPFSESYGLKI
jgi:hypothetical protein